MKPSDIVMYLVDNKLILWFEKNLDKPIIEQLPKAIIKDGKVSKPTEFTKQLNGIVKKYNINKGLFTKDIYSIITPSYTKADIKVLYDCLEKCNFNQIKMINFLSLFNIKKNSLWLIANTYYMFIIFIDSKLKTQSLFLDYKLFKNNLSLIIKHVGMFINNKNIILLGHYPDIPLLADKIEKNTNTKVYYYNDINSYIIKNFINTLKD